MSGSAVRDIRLDTHVHVPFFIPVRVTASRIERIAASRPAVTCRLPVVQFFPPASAFLHAHHFGIFLFLLPARSRSEEHTSELQSRFDLVCRLLLEHKNNMDHGV